MVKRSDMVTWASMIRATLRVANDVVAKIPKRDDPLLAKIAKVLAVGDAVRREAGFGEGSVLRSVCDRYGLTEKTSPAFVRLFFGTSMREDFVLQRTRPDPHTELVLARAPCGGRILFEENRWNRVEVLPTFYVSNGFDFASATRPLWGRNPAGILLTVGEQRHPAFVPMRSSPSELYTANSEAIVARLVKEHSAHMAGNNRCTYLFFGPPGTGKTSAAMHIALGSHEPRILRVDPDTMATMETQDVVFLLDVLRPSFVIVDDIDRAPVDQASARALALVEALRMNGSTLVFTANQPHRMGRAMLRPGRIDIPVAFDAPDAAERAELVQRYCTANGIQVSREMVDAIVDATDGLTHAYIVHVCRRAMAQPLAAVLASVRLLGTLADLAGDSAGEAKALPTKRANGINGAAARAGAS